MQCQDIVAHADVVFDLNQVAVSAQSQVIVADVPQWRMSRSGGCPQMMHGMEKQSKATFTSFDGTPVREMSPKMLVG